MTGAADQAKPLRLAFVLPNLGGGGAERVALTLIADFVARGHEIDLLLMRAEGELLPLVPEGVQVLDLKAKRIRGAVPAIASYLRREKPDGIQISMWPLTVAGILAHRLSGSRARLIVSDHSALSKQYAERGLFHRQLIKWTIRLFYPLADSRVVVAAATAKNLAVLSGLPQNSFEVIYNPVGLAGPQTRDPAIERFWGGSGYRILNVGRMTPEKNQILLLEAFARMPGHRDARLVIFGKGELRGELEAHAVKLGIADQVTMPGFVVDLTPFYSSADLFVLSSDYEGYPLVLIEAMRFGLPIVSTDCTSGPTEILADGQFGRLAPCGDAERLAAAMAEELAVPRDPERLKARAEELSGAHTADRYLELMTGEMVS